MFPADGWPMSETELAFARSLFSDLSALGYQIVADGGLIEFHQTVPRESKDSRIFYSEAYKQLHAMYLFQNRDFLLDFEHRWGPNILIEGKDLTLSRIEPRLRSANLTSTSKAGDRDRAIVKYIRAYQTVSSRRSVGRENVYILEDFGHEKCPLMGVLILSSPRYFQPHRDEVFGWPTPNQLRSLSRRKQAHFQRIRQSGLNRMMQVAVCCAIPPYSQLGAASILALAPFTKRVQSDFRSRWYEKDTNKDPDLAAVSTTTSMGLTGTPFQALYRSMFLGRRWRKSEKWNAEGTIYARIGTHHPWQTRVRIRAKDPRANFLGLLSRDTWLLALAVAGPTIDLKRRASLLDSACPHVKSRILKFALDRVGVSARIFQGNRMGVLLGATDRLSLEALGNGAPRSERATLDWKKIVARFKSEFNVEEGSRLPDTARRSAIRSRILRATNIQLKDILLSSRIK